MPGTNPLPCSHSVMALRVGHEIVLLDTSTGRGASTGPGTTGSFFNETVTWSGDSTTGNWTVVSTSGVDPLGPLPVRADTGMDFDGTNMVLFGGRGESEAAGVFNDTWLWSGTAWTKATPGTSPFGRYRHEISKLNGVGALMFGGCTVLNLLEETWLWNGSNWSLLAPGTVPPARTDFAMAGSSAATNILMFGGKGTNACLNDTWMWVGTASGNWVQQTPAVSPPALAECAMAYDAANSQYVLFGGRTDEAFSGPQTWVWTGGNGGNWHLTTPAVSPSVRVGAQMAYDGTHVIMFGGSSEYDVKGETWMWTGGTNGNWVQL
jgi:hypothetical protein